MVIALLVIYAAATCFVSFYYGLSLAASARTIPRHLAILGIEAGVSIWDPCSPRTAPDGPATEYAPPAEECARLEDFMQKHSQARGWTIGEIRNPHIAVGRLPFRYQPFDEPRLQQLREKYKLAELVAAAPTEFEGMVRLRGWARSQFRRRDYQPLMANFDALTILERKLINPIDRPVDLAREYDACHFFPLFYCQLMASVGHHARVVNTAHGQTEAWSNQFNKWVLMDAELNLHYELDGVPLNMLEMYRLRGKAARSGVRVVQTEQTSGDPSTTLVHLGIERLGPDHIFRNTETLEIVEMRNDWMTNHYFPGHPARSERSSLRYVPAEVRKPLNFVRALRPTTENTSDLYWPLNQCELRVDPSSEERALKLALRTVTPNFDHFEIVVDSEQPSRIAGATFEWRLHKGRNTLSVRPVNTLGVRGVESRVDTVIDEKTGRDSE